MSDFTPKSGIIEDSSNIGLTNLAVILHRH